MKALAPSPKPVTPKTDIDELLDKSDQETGRTPLEVMLANMRFYDAQAERLLKQLEQLIVRADDPQNRALAQETLKEFLAMREKAQSAARDVAPFCHGRLAPTDQTPLPSQKQPQPFVDWEHISPEQAAKAYQTIVRAGRAR